MSMKDMPFVSVVVPVYNVEKYIARCIESILHQTHCNLELILVDDGSPDGSGAICDEYAARDHRIKVIHTPNRGVSGARNTGINNASGEYLIFVDSDDWIEPEHIEVLLPIEDEDLVYGGRKMFVNGEFLQERKISAQTVKCHEWLSDYSGFIQRGLTLFFAAGCYRMDIIRKHNVLFNTNLSISEDGLFNLSYMKYCRKIRYSDTSTYCYEDGDNSSVSLSHSFHLRRMDASIEKIKAIEHMTQKKEYVVRWNEWNGVLRHYRKWLTFNKRIHRKASKKAMKEVYKTSIFRDSIPHMRKNGTVDQKIETYFMRYWTHPLYKPCYSVLVFIGKIKKRVCR